jgi:hypothetical protein
LDERKNQTRLADAMAFSVKSAPANATSVI